MLIKRLKCFELLQFTASWAIPATLARKETSSFPTGSYLIRLVHDSWTRSWTNVQILVNLYQHSCRDRSKTPSISDQ
ncbi:hypothetical protein PAHAL_8G031100 [Panicum hallii]|uniref:Uncharacterized protein n=1 Tax=Panicum hallii TaxID=206008 RepID=A0A2T8I7H3_9POAL|nr:hypothetical protein PAHAL_8G031100 [Panicum hallii]